MSELSTNVHFANVIRARREQLGKSQAEVARALGMRSGEFIGMMESGSRNVPLDRVPALATALELDGPELCKLALSQRHPVFYRALFARKPAPKSRPS